MKKYYLPTPIFWRRIGDGLLGVSTFVTLSAIIEEYKWVAIASLIIGAVGKFLTNLFSVDPQDLFNQEKK